MKNSERVVPKASKISHKVAMEGDVKSLSSFKDYNIIGYAIDLVQCNESLKDIYSNLLGNTIIVKDYKSALKLDAALNNSNRIVTLQGESINRGGSISGGSIQSKSVGVINRTREINTLTKEIGTFDKKIIESEKQINNFQVKLKECDYNLSSLKSREEELKFEVANLNANLERLNLTIKNAEKELQNSEDEIEFLKNSIDKDATEKTETSELIIKLQSELQDLKDENEKISSSITKNSRDYQSLTHEIKDLEIKRVELLNNFSNSGHNLRNAFFACADKEFSPGKGFPSRPILISTPLGMYNGYINAPHGILRFI